MDQMGAHMTFGYFQIQKWMLQKVRAEKLDENNGMGSFVKFPWILVKLWPLKCQKKCVFGIFLLTSARNMSLLKQLTYMHLKVLITLSQKMIWFIAVWPTIHEISAIKISKNMLTQQEFNKIPRLQTPLSPKQYVSA